MVKYIQIICLLILVALSACSQNAAEPAPPLVQTPQPPRAANIQVKKSLLPDVGEVVIVEIDSFKVFDSNTGISVAESQTREMMRKLALEKALPADISLNSLSATMHVERNARFDESTATGIFMMSSSAGRFLKEDFLERGASVDTQTNTLKYRMHYRATILPQGRSYNPSMNLQLQVSETLLKEGDNFVVSLKPNTSGYFYFFNFLSDGSVALVLPNLDNSDNYLKAGESWQNTFSCRCALDRDYTIETLYFVFSKDPIAGWEDFRSNRNSQDFVFSAGEESFVLFQKWLAKSDPMRRTDNYAQVHIFR